MPMISGLMFRNSGAPIRSTIHTMKTDRTAIHTMHMTNVPKNQNFGRFGRRHSGMVSQNASESGKPKIQKKRASRPLADE